MTLHNRRGFLQAAGVATLLLAASLPAAAQDAYPTRPITLVVLVPAGGYPDIAARLIGQSLSQRLGQPVIIDNRPGVGGNRALEAVVKADPDGYTLLLAATPQAVNATLYEGSNLNIARDIEPVAGIARNPLLLVVGADSQFNSVSDLVTYAKEHPGELNLTSTGTGNLTHLSGELFEMMAGIDLVHVPYDGAVGAHAGLVAGEVHLMFDGAGSSAPQVQAGRLRALAATSPERWSGLPDVPSLSESVPNYSVEGWLGVGAPKGTPPEIIEKLNQEINAVLAEPEVQERLTSLGAEPILGTPADFGKYLVGDTEKWGEVVRTLGLKAE
jgi:tripartite-type tricarboxylate transporter receptor subunit TctC